MAGDNERKLILGKIEPGSYDAYESNKLVYQFSKERDYGAEHAQINIQNRRKKQELRQRWDKTLRILVITGFALSYLTIFLIGIKKLTFPNNTFAVPSVVAVSIVQTYGLSKLAVSYFFSDDPEDNIT